MAMTHTPPDVQLQGRYSVQDSCKLLGIGRSTLYRHVQMGNISVHFWAKNGRPFFFGKDLLAFWKAAM